MTIGDKKLNVVTACSYRGLNICNDLSDDADLKSKSRQMYAKSNTLRQKCHMCSTAVKVKLFTAYFSDVIIIMLLLSLIHVLNTIHEDQDTNDEAPALIRHSSYYDDVKLMNELNNNRIQFNILSLNCASINAKIDQIRLKLAQHKEGGCEFDAICLQETWLSEDSDKSLLCLEDYALISLGKTCSTLGGLIIYLKENLKYKMLDMSLKSNIWEGQFIAIYEDSLCAKTKNWVMFIDHLMTSMKTTNNLLMNLQLYL